MPKGQFEKGHKKLGGLKKGGKHKRTIILERVYQRCCEVGFHPADYMIELARDPEVPKELRIKMCETLLMYMEGKQPESKPLTPATPADSIEAANATMAKLTALSEPLEPAKS